MTINPRNNLAAEHMFIIFLLPVLALIGIAIAWLLGLWHNELIWVPVISGAISALSLLFYRPLNAGAIHINGEGLIVETISGEMIPWGAVGEISYSDAGLKKPPFLVIDPAPDKTLPSPDTRGITFDNPPMAFNRDGSLFINLSCYEEAPAEIFFQARKAFVRWSHR